MREHLTQESTYWYGRYMELLDDEAQGKRVRLRPETAQRRAWELEDRLERRLRHLALDERLLARPPRVAGGALVLPQGLVDRLTVHGTHASPDDVAAACGSSASPRETARVERRAVAAAVAAERHLGRRPEEMPHNNKGFDLRSWTADGKNLLHLEVKGRVAGAPDFTVTRNEVLHAKNLGDRYRLALVAVSPDGPEHDEVRYLGHPFRGTSTDDFNVTKFVFHWQRMWGQGAEPY